MESTEATTGFGYVLSGPPMTFVVTQMNALQEADCEITPLISRRPKSADTMSVAQRQWHEKSKYRPGMGQMAWDALYMAVRHPPRMLAMAGWVCRLALRSPADALKALYECSVAPHFARLVHTHNIQRLHCHFASRSLSLSLLIRILTDIPVDCTTHAFDLYTRSPKSLRWRLGQCDVMYTISEYNRRFIEEHIDPDLGSRTHVVYLGADRQHFRLVSRPQTFRRFLSITRLTPHKGLDVALKACHILQRRGVDFSYDIIGAGEEEKRLARDIQRLGLSDRVRLCGPCPQDHLQQELAQADVFVLPCVVLKNGDHDGLPVALMEAMATGIATISTNISAIPELIQNDHHGILVPPQDPTSLANAMEELLENPQKRQNLGHQAHQRIQETFDAQKNALHYLGFSLRYAGVKS